MKVNDKVPQHTDYELRDLTVRSSGVEELGRASSMNINLID